MSGHESSGRRRRDPRRGDRHNKLLTRYPELQQASSGYQPVSSDLQQRPTDNPSERRPLNPWELGTAARLTTVTGREISQERRGERSTRDNLLRTYPHLQQASLEDYLVPPNLQQQPAGHPSQPIAPQSSVPGLGPATRPSRGKGSRGRYKRSKAREREVEANSRAEENLTAGYNQTLAKAIEKHKPGTDAPTRNLGEPLTNFSGALVSVLPAIAGKSPQPRVPSRQARSPSPRNTSSTRRRRDHEQTSRLTSEEATRQNLAGDRGPRRRPLVEARERLRNESPSEPETDEDGMNARRVIDTSADITASGLDVTAGQAATTSLSNSQKHSLRLMDHPESFFPTYTTPSRRSQDLNRRYMDADVTERAAEDNRRKRRRDADRVRLEAKKKKGSK